MKKILLILTIISTFLTFHNSIIHAQGYFSFWQYPNFYGQYGQQYGVQPFASGYFQSFNPIGQYGQQWFGSFNSIPQSYTSQLRLSSESSPSFMFNSSPAISSFESIPNNFSYAPSINGFGYQSIGNWGSSFYYAQPPLTTLSPLGWRSEGPYYPNLIGIINTPSNDPFHPDALWNLNWQLKKTDVSLENPENGKSITIHKGKTLGLILPNSRDEGIIWELDDDDINEAIIEKISDDQYPGYFTGSRWAPQPVLGKEHWIFEAIGTGTTTIKMDHVDTTGRLDTVSIEIEVKVI